MKRFFLILLVLAIIIITPACQKKTENSILGRWEFSLSTGNAIKMETCPTTFVQTLTQGYWIMDVGDNETIQGTFRVDGDTVVMLITNASYRNGVIGNFTGTFDDNNKMSGDFKKKEGNDQPITGAWKAIRK